MNLAQDVEKLGHEFTAMLMIPDIMVGVDYEGNGIVTIAIIWSCTMSRSQLQSITYRHRRFAQVVVQQRQKRIQKAVLAGIILTGKGIVEVVETG